MELSIAKKEVYILGVVSFVPWIFGNSCAESKRRVDACFSSYTVYMLHLDWGDGDQQ
jgi:hypothetical protein